jgi:hypothetical protein
LVSKQTISTSKLHHLNPSFTKAYRENRVLTNLPDGILNVSKDSNQMGGVKKNVKINRKVFETVLNKMKSNKDLMKSFLELTKGNDKFHTISMLFKVITLDNGERIIHWFTENTTFTEPILRAFFKFSNRRTEKNRIIYDFRPYDNNGVVLPPDELGYGYDYDYDSLLKFLEFVNNRNISRVKKHTPDREKREILRKFVSKVERYLNEPSASLEEIHVLPSEELDSNALTNPVKFSEMEVRNVEAKYINSKYFVSELTTIEDDKFVNPNLNFEEEFSKCTNGGSGNRRLYRDSGIQYLKQSCLATCALLHMYIHQGNSKGKVKWWNWNSLIKFPPPTYDSISEMCGVPFQNEGLPMSLTQLEPFLEYYSMPCYVITPMGDLVYRYNPINIEPNLQKRLGVCGLTLIISNGHVNQIPINLATSFAGTFKDLEPIVCDKQNKLIYEFYQPKSKPNTSDLIGTFKKFPIRKSFEPSKGFAVDTKSMNIEKDSDNIVATIRNEVDIIMKTFSSSSKTPKKQIISKRVLISYHYIGCKVSIIECLKTKHNYVANNLILSGSKSDIIQSFDISYSNPYVQATLRIGNMLQAGLEYNDADVVANLVKTEDQMVEYNSEFKRFYQKLYNKETIQTYSENLLENLMKYPCPPKGFSIMESFSSKEILRLELQENTERAEEGLEPLDNSELEERAMWRVKRVGAIDANKAYASNMLKTGRVVTFPPYSGFVSKSVKITKNNIHEIKDNNFYRVTGQLTGDIKGYLMFDKKYIIYYGSILKEIITLLPDFTFSISAMCVAYKAIKIDWSSDIKRLYANEKLSTAQKKAIPNVLLGCCDKYRSTIITGECYYSKNDADTAYNISPNLTRVQVAKKQNDETETLWEDCEKDVMAKLEKQLEDEIDYELSYKSQYYDCGPMPLEDCDTKPLPVTPTTPAISYDIYNLTNNEYQKKLYKLHINVNEKKESLFNQGFLPISVMKYNTQRLSLLKWWIKIENSGTILPIACKTDSIFVCDNNALNRELLNSSLANLGFKGYE